ncbi:MAG: arginase family protein [Dehalococcoidia bacterium]
MSAESIHPTPTKERHPTPESERLTHAMPRSFFGAPLCENLDELSARVALLGVPYDFGTIIPHLRTGSSQGPDAIRDTGTYPFSYFDLETGEEAPGWFDVEDEEEYLKGVTMADCGNVSIMGGAVEDNLDRITRTVERIVARDALVAAVGGDHSISFPVGRGMERYEEVDVVHFDAHHDFSDQVNGSKYSHGSQLRRLSELPFVRNITMIGLRRCGKKVYQEAIARDVNIVTSRKLIADGAVEAVEKSVRPSRFLYVSIDTDVLDVGLVPGTCLPEPEGIPYQLLRQALWEVCKKGRIVGFDVVELSPPHDFSGVSARVASWLLVHFLSAITASQE